MPKFYGTPDEFMWRLSVLSGTWTKPSINSSVYTFRTPMGATVHWWPATGTVQVFGYRIGRVDLHKLIADLLEQDEQGVAESAPEPKLEPEPSAYIFLTTEAGRVALRRRAEYAIFEAPEYMRNGAGNTHSIVFTSVRAEPFYVLEPVDKVMAILEGAK